ncbi:MAG: hypothetical protein EKK41_15190 [Hyphomicrobiales bacterium]|nr:MAG: hypothetical protein EKK41_15190 [Hyphomicrobiales bacterium]
MRSGKPGWRSASARYLAVIAVIHLVWEVVQLPLYTLWTEGTRAAQVFAVLHCTAGDVLIAASTLGCGLLIAGGRDWPAMRFWPVAGITMVLGLTYTGLSEWLNVYVRQSWTYSPLMPTLAFGQIRIGLSPLAQWLIVPGLGFAMVQYRQRHNLKH